jgi:hypothetical protein
MPEQPVRSSPNRHPDPIWLREGTRLSDLGFRRESTLILATGFLNRVSQVRILPRAPAGVECAYTPKKRGVQARSQRSSWLDSVDDPLYKSTTQMSDTKAITMNWWPAS